MSKNVPTPEMIADEIAKLRAMQPNVRETSMFGENHHDAIRAQIDVLENLRSHDEIYTQYGDENDEDFAQNVLDEALAASSFLSGQAEDGETPSEAWTSLVS